MLEFSRLYRGLGEQAPMIGGTDPVKGFTEIARQPPARRACSYG
jgi:hypothetical protein